MTVAQPEALCGKMFVPTPMDGSEGGRPSFEVPDGRFLELTDQPGIIPAPYLARAHRISIIAPGCSGTAELAAFIRDSYRLVRAKLTRKRQAELAPPADIDKGKA
jgi:predicted DNA-binding protein (MmcQ/YjbR family)